jgi:glycosyltransferase involved in cell wall biosynthesis
MKAKLSVAIITLNEEKHLPSCLKSVEGIADEIVVVDSGSTDKTVDIARKYGAKVYTKDFDNYANQKNYALSKSTNNWVLSIDADETIEKELAGEIKNMLENPTPGIVGYSIPRKNIIFGKYIKYSRWQPELDRHIWLWDKRYGKWSGKVHEEVMVNGEAGRMKYAKVHTQYEKVSEFMSMMNRYSQFDAESRVEQGISFSYTQFFVSPVYNFLVRYFYRLGILDGWRGFVLSYLMAVYHLQVWIKIWEKQNV